VGIALGRSNETLMVIQIHNPSQSIMQKWIDSSSSIKNGH
jgi:hypothetical protein